MASISGSAMQLWALCLAPSVSRQCMSMCEMLAFGAGGPSLVPFHYGGCGVLGPPALEQIVLFRLGYLIALEDSPEHGLSLSLPHARHVAWCTCSVQTVDGVLAKGGASVSLGCQRPSVLTE
eukprot:117838-Rhodomonas_salina.1